MEKVYSLEKVKKYIESKEADELIDCLEMLEPYSVVIGTGKNAEVRALDEGRFKSVCVKKLIKEPKIKCNDIDTEVEFQNIVRELGVKTPLTFAYIKVRDQFGTEEMILMERIYGCSIGDIVYGNARVPENYNHKKFFAKLEENVKRLHENNIYHRDLHEGNVMIDENGDPVIIDFGSAAKQFSGEEKPYKGNALYLNEKTGRYEAADGGFLNDDWAVNALKGRMRPFAENSGKY